MEPTKKGNLTKYIGWGILIILLTIVAYQTYERRGWEEDTICLRREFLDNTSKSVGEGCKLKECQTITNPSINTKIEACICESNGGTVFLKCVEKSLIWRLKE